MLRESLSRRFARQSRFQKHAEPSCGRLPVSGRAAYPAGLVALLATALSAVAGCSGDEEDRGLTYAKDMRPLFADCTTCHRPGAPAGPPPSGFAMDVLNPYGPNGLVVSKNLWKESNLHIDSPINNVTPGDPEDSFLIQKIEEPPVAPEAGAGSPMPYQPERLTVAELASVRVWIQAGATQSAQFLAEVLPIIGSDGRFGSEPRTYGKCQFCHYEGAPNAPNLSDPFGPDGLVNVPASYRDGAIRVVPGDPDASFLITKLEAVDTTRENGDPMPRHYDRLTALQVDRVRDWIAAGARP